MRTKECRYGHFDCAPVAGGPCDDENSRKREHARKVAELIRAARGAMDLACCHGTCAQAREMYADDRVSWSDYLRGLCIEHKALRSALAALEGE